jgi:hypothetical protein
MKLTSKQPLKEVQRPEAEISIGLSPQNTTPQAEEVSEEERAEREQLFKDFHDHMWELRKSSYEEADKLILTLSSAFLGLSLTFLKDIAPNASANVINSLVTSWIAFGIAIGAVLLSHFVGRKSFDLEVDHADQYYREYKDECCNAKNGWITLTSIFNAIGALAFLVGMGLTIYCVSSHMHNGGHIMSNQKTPATTEPATSAISTTPAGMPSPSRESANSVGTEKTPQQKDPQAAKAPQSQAGSADSGSTAHPLRRLRNSHPSVYKSAIPPKMIAVKKRPVSSDSAKPDPQETATAQNAQDGTSNSVTKEQLPTDVSKKGSLPHLPQ